MQGASNLFYELELEIIKVVIVYGLLNASILFIALFFFTLLFGISYIFPLAISLIYLIMYVVINVKKIDYKEIEDNNPEVKELLRTTFDNMDCDDVMALACFYELKQKIKQVNTANFLDINTLYKKIGILIGIALITVVFTSFLINFQNVNFEIGEITFFTKEKVKHDIDFSYIQPEDPDFLGDPSIALLGQEELELKLEAALDGIDFNDPIDGDGSEFGEEEDQDEYIYAKAEKNYEGDKSLDEHKAVVKSYFNKIKTIE